MAHPTPEHLTTLVNAAQIAPFHQLSSHCQSQLLLALRDAEVAQQVCQISPQTQQELAHVVDHCHQQGWQILPMGSGSKISWGFPLRATDLVLISTQRLDRILDHAAADLTVTLEAGVALPVLQAHLQQNQQFWPVNPIYGSQATLGGIIAANTSGSWRHRYGGIRDLILGITMVRADGQIAKAGGRVVKNVAGYDLMKLFTGSYGTLGILTQLTLRLYPLPQQRQIRLIQGPLAELEILRGQLFNSTLTPVSLDLLSTALTQSLQTSSSHGPSLLIRFHGLPESVTAQVSRLQDMITSPCLQISTLDLPEAEIDRRLSTPLESPAGPLIKLGLLPTQICSLLKRIESLDPQGNLQIHSSGVGRWRGSTEIDPQSLIQLRADLQSQQGYLTLLETPPTWPGSSLPEISPIQKLLKQQFDPEHRLSPGRLP